MTKRKTLPQPKTCACGARGTWQPSRVVLGTSEGKRVAWAGCPNCAGRAVGPAVAERAYMAAPRTEAS